MKINGNSQSKLKLSTDYPLRFLEKCQKPSLKSPKSTAMNANIMNLLRHITFKLKTCIKTYSSENSSFDLSQSEFKNVSVERSSTNARYILIENSIMIYQIRKAKHALDSHRINSMTTLIIDIINGNSITFDIEIMIVIR